MSRTHRISRVIEFLGTDTLNQYLRESDGTITAMTTIPAEEKGVYLVLAAIEGRHPLTEKDEVSLA